MPEVGGVPVACFTTLFVICLGSWDWSWRCAFGVAQSQPKSSSPEPWKKSPFYRRSLRRLLLRVKRNPDHNPDRLGTISEFSLLCGVVWCGGVWCGRCGVVWKVWCGRFGLPPLPPLHDHHAFNSLATLPHHTHARAHAHAPRRLHFICCCCCCRLFSSFFFFPYSCHVVLVLVLIRASVPVLVLIAVVTSAAASAVLVLSLLP